MGKTLYVFSSATLRRRDNTLMLQTKNNGSSYIPVETVDEILIMGEAEINKNLIELLSEKGIVLHFFNHYGKYTGTYSPPENKNSGQVFLSQASHWLVVSPTVVRVIPLVPAVFQFPHRLRVLLMHHPQKFWVDCSAVVFKSSLVYPNRPPYLLFVRRHYVH